jgi:probable rRNA maturation factor
VFDHRISVVNRQRARWVDTARLRSFLVRVVRLFPPPAGASELAVCLVSDRRMRDLNRRFRGKDATTDVLSFPCGERPSPAGRCVLGDVALSVPVARSQARAAGHSLDRELRLLALHGYLHLLGYDHERDDGRMRRIERRLRRRLLPRGAAERTRSGA